MMKIKWLSLDNHVHNIHANHHDLYPRPVRRGGSRGFGRTPLSWLSYVTLDDGLSSKDDGYLLLCAYRKASGRASGVARFRESYFTRERGLVWTWEQRDSLTDNSPRPPPRTGPSSDDIAASVGAMTVSTKRGS